MKFDYKAYETKIIDELDILLHTKSNNVLSKIGSSTQLQDVIKKEFNILFYLITKNKSSDTLPKKLLNRFNELSKLKFEFDSKYKPKDNYQMVDDINYLSVYIKNIFKVDLHDLGKLDTVKLEPVQSNQKDKVVTGAAFAGNVYDNPFLQAPAQMRLQSDIRTGKVYPYKTKPTLILNIKKAMIYLLLIFSISLILTGIFMIACVSIKDGIVIDDKQQTIPTAFSGAMYIVISLFFCFYSYKIYKDIYDKKRTNDCLKYRFDYNSIFFPIFLFVFYVIFGLFYIKYANNVWFFQSLDDFIKANMNVATQLRGWAASEIITLVLFVVVIVMIIIAKVYNPKPDTEKLKELLAKYIDEMSRATGVGSNAF